MPSIEFSTTPPKPSSVATSAGVEAERVAGERTGTVRREVRATVPVGEAVEVAHERPAVREQVVREQHRLGVLQVGAARHDRGRVRSACAARASIRSISRSRDRDRVVAQQHPDEGGDLVVAAAAGAQLAAELAAGDLDQAALEGAVHVFVARGRQEPAVAHALLERGERGEHAGELRLVR